MTIVTPNNNPDEFKDHLVLITGGTSGIGLTCARDFISHGAHVMVCGRRQDRLDSAQKALGDQAIAVQCDVSNLQSISDMYQVVKTQGKCIKTLVVNAAVAKAASFANIDEEMFDLTFDINLKGAFFTIQKALPFLQEGSTIVVITSISNQHAAPNFSAYSAAKSALRSLVKSISLDLINKGIRVNAVSPGPISTDMYDKFGLAQSETEKIKQVISNKSPIKRFGTPQETANAIRFLASSESSYIVGAELVVDGGISLL
ncbi:short chain dehydrogenase [Catenovulum agarivorans DS-2]|uniref:Short chain dehydrogenase n=1 Tax=Catenovulum agarivorans DS-2 TaxID=1328313 RepID=W7QH36_9ALTE|nr:SDR family oxidoreductase [Catenovulum agarivorans]EWH11181.1 short chain dehydrogenase [Catenovulum agarivorans DS-2]